jgi:predicted MFS family arabinose efflux permease
LAGDTTTATTPACERPQKAFRQANYVLAILTVINVLNYADRGIFSLLLDSIKKEFRLTDTVMGVISGFGFVLFYSFLGLPIARWADRFNRRLILTAGLTVWSAMTCLSGLARGAWQLTFARFGVGAGEACGVAPSHSMLSDLFSKQRLPYAMSILTAGSSVGIFLGSVVGGVVNQYYGWREAFFVAGLPGLGVALLFRFSVKEPERGAMEGPRTSKDLLSIRQTLLFLLRQRSYVLMILGGSLVAVALFGFEVWTAPFLHRVHHLSSARIGTYQGAIALVFGVTGVLLGGYLAEKLGKRDIRWRLNVPALASALCCPMDLLFIFMPSRAAAIVFWILGRICISAYTGPIYAVYQTVSKVRMRALASALFLFCGNVIGLGIGSWLIGLMSTRLSSRYGDLSLRYALVLPSLCALLAGILFWMASRHLEGDVARVSADR